MRKLSFYEVVDVRIGSNAEALGVGNTRGIVVGISGEVNETAYAVLIGDRTVMLDPTDLVPTGEILEREAVYGEETLSISPERYPNSET